MAFDNAASDCAQFLQLVTVQGWLSICHPAAVKTIWTWLRRTTSGTTWLTHAKDPWKQSVGTDCAPGKTTQSWPVYTWPLQHLAFTQSGPVNTQPLQHLAFAQSGPVYTLPLHHLGFPKAYNEMQSWVVDQIRPGHQAWLHSTDEALALQPQSFPH